jgi:hypothetical protein
MTLTYKKNFLGRKRKWFSFKDAYEILALHKPVQLEYLQNMSSKHKVI